MADGHDPYAALRSRDYRLLLSAILLTSVGAEMQATAVGWELYRRTGEPLDLGLVGIVQFLPIFLLALPAGHAADRHSRKGLLLAALTLALLASAGLAVLSAVQGSRVLIYLCLLLAGVGQAFGRPARWALLPRVVPADALANAMTWQSGCWQVASLLGPVLAGQVLEHTRRPVWAYLPAGLCFTGACGCGLLLRTHASVREREPVSLSSLLDGIRFVGRTKPILATITLDLFAVLLGGAVALLPVFQKDILKVGPAWLGWLRAAPSLGALGMALLLAHRGPLRRPGRALLWAVAGFGAATVAFGFSTNPVLSVALLALTGAFDNVSVVVRGTLVQVLTPDAMRGRVSAVNAVFISSSNELGAFESGLTAQWFGPVTSVVGGGIGTILVVLAVMAAWPQVLRLGPLGALKPDASVEGEGGLSAEEYPPPRK
jgi:MFS family permease